jgi:hypothetical protein
MSSIRGCVVGEAVAPQREDSTADGLGGFRPVGVADEQPLHTRSVASVGYEAAGRPALGTGGT